MSPRNGLALNEIESDVKEGREAQARYNAIPRIVGKPTVKFESAKCAKCGASFLSQFLACGDLRFLQTKHCERCLT